MKLLFRRNIFYSIEFSKTNCPAWDNDFSKCLHPEYLKISKVLDSFKDEPERFIEMSYCNYKKYYGPSGISKSQVTRAQYESMMKNVLCKHPAELKRKQGYRCWRCNDDVSSERERHNCSGG